MGALADDICVKLDDGRSWVYPSRVHYIYVTNVSFNIEKGDIS